MPIIQHHDFVCLHDCRQAVRYRNHRTFGEVVAEGVLDKIVRLMVYVNNLLAVILHVSKQSRSTDLGKPSLHPG